jgi:hypothetical protein
MLWILGKFFDMFDWVEDLFDVVFLLIAGVAGWFSLEILWEMVRVSVRTHHH